MKTLLDLARDLDAGATTSRQLVEDCLERAQDPGGEGGRVFLAIDADAARADADHMDALRARGRSLSLFAGIPVSYKDLFDVAGEVTRAGSVVLEDAAPALADCAVVASMRAAGFVQIGRTNMTEFAFSGVGINPHYDTPRCAWDRETGRVPGGSSSGAAISITDAMAAVALGSDTGGSCRIPAALNGIVGYKPTAWRVPTEGVYPLSFSLDSVGPLGRSVSCCAIVDGIISGEGGGFDSTRDLDGIRLGALQTFVLEGLDERVARDYERALNALSARGAHIVDFAFEDLNELPQLNAKGGIAAAEANAWHEDMLAEHGERYDQRVGTRIAMGQMQSSADYIGLMTARREMIARADAVTAPFDAVILPSVAIVAPAISAFDKDEDYLQLNMTLLRNTAVGNFFDRCAISLPAHDSGAAPTGVMLMGARGGDDELFEVAQAVEAVLDEVRS